MTSNQTKKKLYLIWPVFQTSRLVPKQMKGYGASFSIQCNAGRGEVFSLDLQFWRCQEVAVASFLLALIQRRARDVSTKKGTIWPGASVAKWSWWVMMSFVFADPRGTPVMVSRHQWRGVSRLYLLALACIHGLSYAN